MKFLKLLHENNCSAIRLAKLLGVERNAIYNWDKLRSSPNPQTILKIKEILGVSAEELLKCFVE